VDRRHFTALLSGVPLLRAFPALTQAAKRLDNWRGVRGCYA
jgi:hypothetical protein